MKKALATIIADKTISAEEFSRNFTPKQWEIVRREVQYYEILIALKQLRKKLGLTQAQLAQKASLPRTTITKIESGSYNPTLQTLMTIASAMEKKLQITLI